MLLFREFSLIFRIMKSKSGNLKLKQLLFVKEGPGGAISSTLFIPSNRFGLGGKEQLAKPNNNQNLVDPEQEEEDRVYPGEDEKMDVVNPMRESSFQATSDPGRGFYRDLPGMMKPVLAAPAQFVPTDTDEYDREAALMEPDMSQTTISTLAFPGQHYEKQIPDESSDEKTGRKPNSKLNRLMNSDELDGFELGNPHQELGVLDRTGKQSDLAYRVNWVGQVDPINPEYEKLNSLEKNTQPPNGYQKLVKPRRFAPVVVNKDRDMKHSKEPNIQNANDHPITEKTDKKAGTLGAEPIKSTKLSDILFPSKRENGDKTPANKEDLTPLVIRDQDPASSDVDLGLLLWPQKHVPEDKTVKEGIQMVSSRELLQEEKELLEEGFWDWLKSLWYRLIGGGEYEGLYKDSTQFRKDYLRTVLTAKRLYHLAAEYEIFDEDLTDFVERANSELITKQEFVNLVKSKEIDRIFKRVRERLRRATSKEEANRNMRDDD